MKCEWCKKELNGNGKFCSTCGAPVVKEEPQPVQNNIQTNYQQPVVNTNFQNQQTVQTNDKANIGLAILSFFIPLAGLIIFLVKKDDDKKTAKASGLAALISVGISIILTILGLVLIYNGTKNFVDDALDYTENIDTVLPDVDYDDTTNSDNNYDEEDTATSSEWTNYEIIINNENITLPCSYETLSTKTIATMNDASALSYLQPNYYSLVNLYKDGNLVLYTEIFNDTDTNILYTQGKVTRVSQTKYHITMGATEITFPGNLKAGQEITKEQLIELFGEPSNEYNYTSDGYISDKYSYYSDSIFTTTNYYEIVVVNGVIDQITLDHRNYKTQE